MFASRRVSGLLLVCLALSIAGCANSGLDSIQISPTTQSLTVGQSAQFTAAGTFGNAGHQSTQSVSAGITWTSSAPAVAAISSSGVATAVGSGTTTITATATAYNGSISSSATLTVSGSSGTSTGGLVTSLAIIPGSQAVSAPAQTTQFLAIGSTSSGATVNLTNQVAWISSSTQIATIGATTGFATAVGQGSTTITALYSNSGGSVVSGTASFTVSGGTTEKYTAVAITPGSQALSASGQTGQFIATGTAGGTGLQTNVTSSSQIAWTSSIPSIATVSATGLVTGVSPGSTTITAQLTNPDSTVVSSTASVSVTLTTAPEPILSLTIIPSTITAGNLGDTGQFLAIGTFTTPPYVRDLTNSPTLTWISTEPNYFPVNTNTGGNSGASAGLVTAEFGGSGVIIAEATSTDGTIQTATATFNCPVALANPAGNPPTPATCIPGTEAAGLLATITVYNEGLNATNWQVTAPSATFTPNVLHCGPGWSLNSNNTGGSVCTATYPVGSQVILTATQPTASPANQTFGGWSYNCIPSNSSGVPLTAPPYYTATGPNYCVVTLNTNDTVGAIFN
jgi:Bacterial Ig-like domain (group 2)